MNIRRFTAPDARRAIRQVRDELGPDAVILSNRRIGDEVEIVAAVDYDEQAARLAGPALPGFRPAFAAQPDPGPEPEPAAEAATAAASGAATEGVGDLRREVAALRDLLETELSRLGWNEQTRRTPLQAQAMRNLASLGFTPDVVADITAGLDPLASFDDAWQQPLEAVVDRLPVLEEEVIAHPGVVALVGPTGVGKTTAIAKLAARYTIRHAPRSLALVTTDGYRIGAREQLQAFGRILGAPVHVASDGRDLRRLLGSLAGTDLVLVDTTGMGQRDIRLAEQLSMLAPADLPIRYLLTLPANVQVQSLQEIVEAYAGLGPGGCVLTKVDEAASLGEALSVILRNRLPLAYVSAGQRVPEDLHEGRPRREWLLKAAAERLRESGEQVSEDYMARHFSEQRVHAYA